MVRDEMLACLFLDGFCSDPDTSLRKHSDRRTFLLRTSSRQVPNAWRAVMRITL